MDRASKFKRVCVFCGSNPGYKKIFSDAAIELGNEMVGYFSFIKALIFVSVLDIILHLLNYSVETFNNGILVF